MDLGWLFPENLYLLHGFGLVISWEPVFFTWVWACHFLRTCICYMGLGWSFPENLYFLHGFGWLFPGTWICYMGLGWVWSVFWLGTYICYIGLGSFISILTYPDLEAPNLLHSSVLNGWDPHKPLNKEAKEQNKVDLTFRSNRTKPATLWEVFGCVWYLDFALEAEKKIIRPTVKGFLVRPKSSKTRIWRQSLHVFTQDSTRRECQPAAGQSVFWKHTIQARNAFPWYQKARWGLRRSLSTRQTPRTGHQLVLCSLGIFSWNNIVSIVKRFSSS